ncbi:MAG: discoidin domain-containing protein [Phycisphaerae bacterium]|nr:discoidin domain-containing protein [Phycisphaerae bacterium]
MTHATRIGLAVVAVAALPLGCEPSELYRNTRQFTEDTLAPRSEWQARGRGFDAPPHAIDSNTQTVARTRRGYGDASLTLDLGDVCLFNMVILDHGSAGEMGFAGRVAVLTSIDGKTFTRCAAAPGTRRITLIPVVTPTLARYVRIQAVSPGGRPWSIAEVHLQ